MYRQKRPSIQAKETWYTGKRDLAYNADEVGVLNASVSKET